MNELEPVDQKEVNFQGIELKAVKAEDGNVYVGMKWVITGIGFKDRKAYTEIDKAKQDAVVSRGVRNFVVPTAGGKQQVKCIDIEFLPIWLAKISITPKIKENNPEVTWRMQQFQLKAKDVLAEAFLKNGRNQKPTDKTNEFDLMRKVIDKLEENDQRLAKVEEKLDVEITAEDVNASDIARQLGLTTAKGYPHNGLIGAIANKVGLNTRLKTHYSDDYIKIIPDSDGNGYRCYYRPAGAKKIMKWFEENETDIRYKEKYIRGGKYGDPGELKEAGYKIDGIKYKTYMAKHNSEEAV